MPTTRNQAKAAARAKRQAEEAFETPQKKLARSSVVTATLDRKRTSDDNESQSTTSTTSTVCNNLVLLPSFVQLPPEVPNIFSFPRSTYTLCQCEVPQPTKANSMPISCIGRCHAANYLHCYGWDYRALLKEKEEREHKYDFDFDENADPYELLVESSVVPPEENRTRQQTDWAQPTQYDLEDYMERRKPDLAPKMRAILIDWIVELSEEYKLSHTTFHTAVSLIDKSLACPNLMEDEKIEDSDGIYVRRDLLQCLGCACTWIAAKMEEKRPPKLSDFVFISDSIYLEEQIVRMEKDVCSVLKFNLQHITPVSYAHEFLLASEVGPNHNCKLLGRIFHVPMRNMTFYLMELSRMIYDLLPTKPSLVAACCVYLARATLGIQDLTSHGIGPKGYWTKTLEYYTGYSVDECRFQEVVKILLDSHQNAESHAKATYKKYNKSYYQYISAKLALNEEDLDFDS